VLGEHGGSIDEHPLNEQIEIGRMFFENIEYYPTFRTPLDFIRDVGCFPISDTNKFHELGCHVRNVGYKHLNISFSTFRSSYRRTPVSRKSAEKLDAGFRRHDEVGATKYRRTCGWVLIS